jgi:hypothetical protein
MVCDECTTCAAYIHPDKPGHEPEWANGKVRQLTRLFAMPFDTKNDRFAKTGSGQTWRNYFKRDAFFVAVAPDYRQPAT